MNPTAINLASVSALRLGVFLATLAVLVVLESVAPRRRRATRGVRRSINNVLLLTLGTVAVRLIPTLSAAGAAAWASGVGVGLLPLIGAPTWVGVFVILILFDLLIYTQHVVSHRFPLLWRFHKVHHADLDLDASSGLRMHPGEILFSAVVKCVGAVALGAPAEGVVLFEIVLNAAALFNHANVALPRWLDATLRRVIVTPDMHRVHHSVRRAEANTNFGFCLPWWDWLFGTYLPQPAGDHRRLELGLPGHRDGSHTSSFKGMLMMPFEEDPRDRRLHSGAREATRVKRRPRRSPRPGKAITWTGGEP